MSANYTIIPFSEHPDWDGVTAIFNHYVRTSSAAYPPEVVPNDYVQRMCDPGSENLPFYLLRIDGETVGFAHMSPFFETPSLAGTVGLGYFLDPKVAGQGFGSLLLDRLIADGRALGKREFLVNISSENDASLSFHCKKGFVECGRFRNVGEKFGRRFDLVWMQLSIED